MGVAGEGRQGPAPGRGGRQDQGRDGLHKLHNYLQHLQQT
jgi:hypothetical protein